MGAAGCIDLTNMEYCVINNYNLAIGTMAGFVIPAAIGYGKKKGVSPSYIAKDIIMKKAFIKTYDTYADVIFKHCYFRVFEREKAQELMQETFMKVWKYIADGNEVKNIRALLYTTANNLVIDYVRRKKESSLEFMQEEYGFDPEDKKAFSRLRHAVEVEALQLVIKKLEPEYKQVVIMRYIDGLPPREIAKILGENQNVISVRIHRVYKS